VVAENYRLSSLASLLGLNTTPTHQANVDVRATAQLLHSLIPLVRDQVTQRKVLVNGYGSQFIPFAEKVERWRDKFTTLRPHELLKMILQESGLWAYYAGR
jgi:DNA polymerase III epsilon subunit-like protein